MKDVTEVELLLAKADKQYKKSKKAIKKHNKLTEEAQRLCKHPATKEKSTYFSGSYLDKAETTYYIHCAICGLQLDTRMETHDWYG